MDDLRQFLRVGTRAAHERTEAAFAPFNMMTRAGYVAFLTAQAQAILPLEDALDAFGQTHFVDWHARRRAHLLAADLALLGADDPEPLEAPCFANDGERFGALYVLEGSHMGARLMLKRLLEGGDPACRRATAFLRHGQGHNLWAGFLTRLREMEGTIQRHDASEGALKTFGLFETAARQTRRPSQKVA